MPQPAFFALLIGLAANAQAAAVDLLVYPNAGVFEVEGSRIGGPGAQMLARLQSASGVQLKQQPMPIPRALQLLASRPDTCVVALPRTAEREALFRWAGPWASSVITLYGRADETRQVNGPADMRGTQIAVLRESNPAAWLKEHGITGQEVLDVSMGLRMLQAGRVDYWLGNDMAARFVIKTMSGPLPRALYSFGRIDLHMACHRDTPAAVVERLHAGIEQLRRSGELADYGLR